MTDLGEAEATAGEPQANPPPEPPGLWVRATANLQGLKRDHYAYVNPHNPIVRRHLLADPPWLEPLPGQHWETILKPTE